MYQLRNLINRKNVVSDPKKDMNACEDFFELITNAHILAAAMQKFDMKSLTDPLSSDFFPDSQDLSQKERLAVLDLAVQAILSDFVNISFPKQIKKNSKEPRSYPRVCQRNLNNGLDIFGV